MINFDFKTGIILSSEPELNLSSDIHEQIDVLREDLLQVSYAGNLLLDMGWYPSFDIEGEFSVTVVENDNWEQPLYRAHAKDFHALRCILADAVVVAECHST